MGDTYQGDVGPFIGLSSSFPGQVFDVGNVFTPIGSSFTLDKIELAVNLISGLNELDVQLASDVGGRPGTVIEAFHLSNNMGPFPQVNPPLVVNSGLHPILNEGVPYWIVGSATSETLAIWNENSISQIGLTAQRANGGPWQLFNFLEGAFRVSGTIVPEPSSLMLGTIGTFVLLAFAWHRHARQAAA